VTELTLKLRIDPDVIDYDEVEFVLNSLRGVRVTAFMLWIDGAAAERAMDLGDRGRGGVEEIIPAVAGHCLQIEVDPEQLAVETVPNFAAALRGVGVAEWHEGSILDD
jgi:hypothetical protein